MMRDDDGCRGMSRGSGDLGSRRPEKRKKGQKRKKQKRKLRQNDATRHDRDDVGDKPEDAESMTMQMMVKVD
jgi:hypothetical protein